ncbi:MAG: transcriptional regulator [Alteromonadaceae bacterium]|uniref:helix-turn-helix domain-containing protein n=1 Tax=unclassified Marinobacter TaxID=83889 RepID=UPI000C57EFE1|nr:helix-turn-helix transcriptional regulator [Marinobacter sp. BGYM27]MAA63174.1 transcriptional regulator [Alteromonadaceae bacterium]MBH84164.1 transcriptional regulator [Alteromonadaceae bacterium]MDG5498644.1 helix-turn-helix transcriptional regulator [Marinobacter sp. BGYM27]|tara:strand:- start:48924 stop:49790 length:867 start_codon:yes stop_codon:yes gene_type:complete
MTNGKDASSKQEKARALESLIMDTLHAIQSMNQAEEAGLPPLSETSTPLATDSGSSSDIAGNLTDATEESLLDRLSSLTGSAFRLAQRTTETSRKAAQVLINSQDKLRMMLAAGDSLRDIREVAGLTLSEMSEALNLRDKDMLAAVENGTKTLSFELILRLAALVARNDPVPFIMRYTRNYNPEVWQLLHDWGIGRLPLQFERERQFINIFRSHDAARELSDEGFEKVLAFTRQSFEMSLHFIAEQEKETQELRETLAKPAAKKPKTTAKKADRKKAPASKPRSPRKK